VLLDSQICRFISSLVATRIPPINRHHFTTYHHAQFRASIAFLRIGLDSNQSCALLPGVFTAEKIGNVSENSRLTKRAANVFFSLKKG
jgi:hypothetical protein